MVIAQPSSPPIADCPLRCGPSLDPLVFHDIRRDMVLRGCKWDPQVGDVGTLAPFPLLIGASRWRELCALAERLTAELLEAESELKLRPELHARLGMPRRLRRALRQTQESSGVSVRTMRFDFHWTTDGWRISEVNSDVPGGFAESSYLPALMAGHFPGVRAAGDPGAAWADAIARVAGSSRRVALLAAAGYMEDLQIMAYLRQLLHQRGIAAHMASPCQMRWQNQSAFLQADGSREPVDITVRFFQAEWLGRLRGIDLRPYCGGYGVITNPLFAALTESKRFPLAWSDLVAKLPSWRALLMETRDPRDVRWGQSDDWLLKTAFCNTGDDVCIPTLLSSSRWRQARLLATLMPGGWIAQRRFVACPIDSDLGPIFPSIGVYTIDGRVAGAYGRIATKPMIDFQAIDVAVLIEEDDDR